jgi:hypothetical protein
MAFGKGEGGHDGAAEREEHTKNRRFELRRA